MYFQQSALVQQRAVSPQIAFGARIRELRFASGLTQDDLAERCGLFRTYMSRIETGRANPTLTMIHALATSLEVQVAELFEPAAEAPTLAKRARLHPPRSRGRVR